MAAVHFLISVILALSIVYLILGIAFAAVLLIGLIVEIVRYHKDD